MVDLFGFKIYDGTKREFITNLMGRFVKGEKITIISGNPEVIYTALNNQEIANECRTGDIIPDGIGVILGGMLTGQKFKEKIAGVEILQEILDISSRDGLRIYMLGAEQEVVEKAVRNAREKYGAMVSGHHNGFFDLNNCRNIIDNINDSNADVLFVAMGCPRQEKFIAQYRKELKCRIFMGVGGSFDVLAGRINRAPKWMISIGMEWLYRVVKEPWRIRRLSSIPKFLIKVLLSNIRQA